ncbi:MAG: hypothetical protein ACI8WT_002576 [Clostridium sp.]|jgi:hypothetical protein
MYIDEETIRFYNPTYNCELETQDLPLMCPYRQMDLRYISSFECF